MSQQSSHHPTDFNGRRSRKTSSTRYSLAVPLISFSAKLSALKVTIDSYLRKTQLPGIGPMRKVFALYQKYPSFFYLYPSTTNSSIDWKNRTISSVFPSVQRWSNFSCILFLHNHFTPNMWCGQVSQCWVKVEVVGGTSNLAESETVLPPTVVVCRFWQDILVWARNWMTQLTATITLLHSCQSCQLIRTHHLHHTAESPTKVLCIWFFVPFMDAQQENLNYKTWTRRPDSY